MTRAASFLVACLFLAGSTAVPAKPVIYEAPLDVRETAEAKFVAGPAASNENGMLKITFTVSAATDVEVAIVDAKSRVIRHLAAGLLGKNAPLPLKKESFSQELLWDGCDDAGRPAVGKPFKVRARLGSQAKLEKYLGREPLTLAGDIEAITVGAGGELFVLVGEGFKFGRAEMLVLDKDGNYLRTIMPYPANTPKDRTESVGHLAIDGQRVPILFSDHAFCVYPLVCGIRDQTMAWHPKGYLIAASSTGTAREHGPPRYLIAFDSQGGAPYGMPFVGPKTLEPRGFLGGGGERSAIGLDRLAVSADGRYVYFTQHFTARRFESKFWKHGVYRVQWSDKEAGSLWLGGEKPGTADGAFNDPQGIAVDQQGRVYVCDRGNNRVQVFDADGKFLGKFAAESPEQIGIHPASGAMFVLCRATDSKAAHGKLLTFSAWQDGNSNRLAELEFPGLKLMALDPENSPAKLWVATKDEGQKQALLPISFVGGKFQVGTPVTGSGGLVNPSFLAADPERDRVIVKEHRTARDKRPFRTISLTTGEIRPLDLVGADLTLDAAGNLYVMDGYNTDSLSRYDPLGRPLPFSGTDSHKIALKYDGLGPDMGLFGHRVAPNGDIYVMLTTGKIVGKSLDVYGPDGKLKKRGFIAGLGSGDCGLGLDAAGNVYLGVNLKAAVRPFPGEFLSQVPTSNWVWWKKNQEQPPWAYIYCNPYLFGMGSVMKFGPAGGAVYGDQEAHSGKSIASPGTELEKAPAAAVACKSSYLSRDVKIVGAQWQYDGVGPIPVGVDGPRGDPGCICMPSHLDADLYGRVYAPSSFRFSIEMLDAAGNHIARIGRYGNGDSAGPGSKVPEPEIAFAGPVACDFAEADGKLYVSDIANRRVAVIRFDWTANVECSIR